MATISIDQIYDTGSSLYYRVVRDSDGYVLDFADNTFKVLATTATMHVAMPSVASIGGGDSRYAASLDLADINTTTTPMDVKVIKYLKAGGSIVLADDVWLEQVAVTVISGQIEEELGRQQYYVDLTANYTTTLGVSLHFTAELKSHDGRAVDLATVDPAATCSIVVTMDADESEGERFPVFTFDTTDCGSVNSDSQFEVEYVDPGLVDALLANRGYKVLATITTGGVNYVGDCKFNS